MVVHRIQWIDTLLFNILNALYFAIYEGVWSLLFVILGSPGPLTGQHHLIVLIIAIVCSCSTIVLLMEPCPFPLFLMALWGCGALHLLLTTLLLLRSTLLPMSLRFYLLLQIRNISDILRWKMTYQSVSVSTEAIVNWCNFYVICRRVSRSILCLILRFLTSLPALHSLKI